jgi:hypothetical protein
MRGEFEARPRARWHLNRMRTLVEAIFRIQRLTIRTSYEGTTMISGTEEGRLVGEDDFAPVVFSEVTITVREGKLPALEFGSECEDVSCESSVQSGFIEATRDRGVRDIEVELALDASWPCEWFDVRCECDRRIERLVRASQSTTTSGIVDILALLVELHPVSYSVRGGLHLGGDGCAQLSILVQRDDACTLDGREMLATCVEQRCGRRRRRWRRCGRRRSSCCRCRVVVGTTACDIDAQSRAVALQLDVASARAAGLGATRRTHRSACE